MQKGEEDEAGADTAGFRNLSEESEADFIGEDGKVIVIEHFCYFENLLTQYHVLLIDGGTYLSQLLSKYDVVVQHSSIITEI